MAKEFLEKLRKTKSVPLSTAVVRTLDELELASVVGGQRICSTTSAPNNDCAD
jgi:hypothetical protein